MIDKVLYSTNVFLKLLIQETYWNDVHYVWCSEHYDSKKLSSLSSGSLVAPSSNPADIYNELQRDVKGRDSHSAKINAQKASFTARAIDAFNTGRLSEDQKDEIIYMADTAPFDLWRPLIYVIPLDPIRHKVKKVPISKRAGFGTEYIIPDLERGEFDIIEVNHA